jgi:hypothetical protein
MSLRTVLFVIGFCVVSVGTANIANSAGCGQEVMIGGQSFAALNCCRCKSGGSPCRCGRASGYTSCACTTQCTTGYRDEDSLIQSSLAKTNRLQLVKSGEPAGITLFGGHVYAEPSIHNEAVSGTQVIQFIIKVPSGRLYSQPVTIGEGFEIKIPLQEFNAVLQRDITRIEMGDFFVEATQRAYLITLDRAY